MSSNSIQFQPLHFQPLAIYTHRNFVSQKFHPLQFQPFKNSFRFKCTLWICSFISCCQYEGPRRYLLKYSVIINLYYYH